MEPLRDLPLGFGMALFENEKAAHIFENMSRPEQQQILQQVHDINSKTEMRALVSRIGGEANG